MAALISFIGVVIVGLIATATRQVMRRREELRKIGREAAELDVMTQDTRRAMWISGADHHHQGDDHSDHSSSGGSADGGD